MNTNDGFPIISRLPTSLCWNCYTVSRHPLTWLMNLPELISWCSHKSRLPHGVVIAHKAWTEGISKGPRNMLQNTSLMHFGRCCCMLQECVSSQVPKHTGPTENQQIHHSRLMFSSRRQKTSLRSDAFRRHRQFEQSGHLSRMLPWVKTHDPDGTHSSQMLPCCPDDGIG